MKAWEPRAESWRVLRRRSAARRRVRGASEGGEALLPVGGLGPALLELVKIQPDGSFGEAKVSAGGGPRVGTGGASHVSAHRVQLDVAESGLPMGIVEDARVETVLPNVPYGATGGALGGIAVGGVLAIQIHHEE